MRRAVAASVRAVAVPTRSSDCPTQSSTRSSSKIACASSTNTQRWRSAASSASMRASTRPATGSSASGKAAVRAAVGAMARGYVVPSSHSPSDAARSVRSVAEFLSDEWIAALDAAARATQVDAGDADSLAVEPVVRGVPGRGDVRYRVTCDTGVRAVTRSPDGESADVRIETDYATAVALARGQLNAQTALAD